MLHVVAFLVDRAAARPGGRAKDLEIVLLRHRVRCCSAGNRPGVAAAKPKRQ